MKQKNSYTYEDLINCGDGELFGKGNAKLPLPPMLMFDRITEIQKGTGKFKKGHMKAELDIKDKIINEIKKIYDPEIPVNIFDLGLIYNIKIKDNSEVIIDMTLTSPNCPVAESLPKMVKDNLLKIEEVSDVDLKLVWNPPWTKDMMSEAAKLELNL